jgi:hypothetical protein
MADPLLCGLCNALILLVTKCPFFAGKPPGALEWSGASAVSPGTKFGAACNEMRCALIRQLSEQNRFCRPLERRSMVLVHPEFAQARLAAGAVKRRFM